MRILSIAIALLLAACGPAAEQQTIGPPVEIISQTATIDGKPVDLPVAEGVATPGITADALVGRWGDNGDCAKDIVFAADGTFRSYTGGSGRWSLDGDRVTMAGAGGTFVVQIQSVNDHQLIVGNPDGTFGISQRC